MGVTIPPLAWQWYPLLVGLGLLALAFAAGKYAGPLAVPGSITTTVGLLLLGQQATGRYDTWSWAWLLIFPTSVGAGLWIWGRLAESERLSTVGRWLGLVGLALFGLAALIFEGLVPSGILAHSPVAQTLLPAALIGVGLLLFLRDGGNG